MLHRQPLELPPHRPQSMPGPPQLANSPIKPSSFEKPEPYSKSPRQSNENFLEEESKDEIKSILPENPERDGLLAEILSVGKSGHSKLRRTKRPSLNQPENNVTQFFMGGVPPPPPPPVDEIGLPSPTLPVNSATSLFTPSTAPGNSNMEANEALHEREVHDEEWSDDDSEVVQLRKKVDQLESKLVSARRSIEHLQTVEKKLEKEVSTAQQSIKDEMSKTLEEQEKKHESKVAKLTEELERQQKKSETDMELIQVLKRELSGVEKRRSEIARESEGREREIKKLRENLGKLSTETKAQQSEIAILSGVKEKLEEKTSLLLAKSAEAADLANELEVLKQHHLASLKLIVRASTDAVNLKQSQLVVREAQVAKKHAAVIREHNRHQRMLARAALPKFATVGAASSSSTGKFNAISLGLTDHVKVRTKVDSSETKGEKFRRSKRKPMYPQYQISLRDSKQQLRPGLGKKTSC